MEETQERKRLVARLRRIEGQVRGLQRMIEEERDCVEVVTQLAAVRGALDRVGLVILSHRLEECLQNRLETGEDKEQALEDAMKLFQSLA